MAAVSKVHAACSHCLYVLDSLLHPLTMAEYTGVPKRFKGAPHKHPASAPCVLTDAVDND